jgi:hypothetical protein
MNEEHMDIRTEIDTIKAPIAAFEDQSLLKYSAEIIEHDCPKLLRDLSKQIAAHLDKARKYEEKAEQHYTAVSQLLVQVRDLCDEAGFDAVRKKFFPDLGRSRTYEILAIATGKKSIEDTRATTRERVARHRAKQAESVTVTDSAPTEPTETTKASANARKAIHAQDDAGQDDHAGGDDHDVDDDGPVEAKHEVAHVNQIVAEYFAEATVADILGKLSSAQHLELFDLAIRKYASAETPVAPSKSDKKLLENLNGTLRWGLGQNEPASHALTLKIIKAKLTANKRGADQVCLTFAKKRKR